LSALVSLALLLLASAVNAPAQKAYVSYAVQTMSIEFNYLVSVPLPKTETASLPIQEIMRCLRFWRGRLYHDRHAGSSGKKSPFGANQCRK
jgi:hypothetical protein